MSWATADAAKMSQANKQEIRSVRLMKHNSTFNSKLASDHIADFQQTPGSVPSTWQREITQRMIYISVTR